jgi:hypothetical protein
MKHTPIHEFGRGIQVGAPSPAGAIVAGDTEGEWINTVVMIPFFMQVYGMVTPQNQQLINKIDAQIRARGASQVGPTNVSNQVQTAPADVRTYNLREPTIRGRPVRQVAFTQSMKVVEEP